MSYEYNPASSRFEVPNPHRIENLFLFGAAAICGLGGGAALLIARDSISGASAVPAAMSITLSAILLLFALSFDGHHAAPAALLLRTNGQRLGDQRDRRHREQASSRSAR